MRLNRSEIEKRYPSEELKIELLDGMTMLDASYRELQGLLSSKKWSQLAAKLADVEHQARACGFTVNRIMWPEQKLVSE
jgi:hypothetical protein